MPAKKPINVTVLVDEAHKDKLARVAKDLQLKGFVLHESLEAIGILSGSAPANGIAKLSKVAGVQKVEQERTDYHTQA